VLQKCGFKSPEKTKISPMAEAKETEECILRLDLAVTLTASARF
jgi:hypothetical protein